MAKALQSPRKLQALAYDHVLHYRPCSSTCRLTALRGPCLTGSWRPHLARDQVGEALRASATRFLHRGMSWRPFAEAHEVLAVAMTGFGARATVATGGEDSARFRALEECDAGGTRTLPTIRGLRNGRQAGSAIKHDRLRRFRCDPGLPTQWAAA